MSDREAPRRERSRIPGDEPFAPEERALIPEGTYVWLCERADPGPGWEDRRTGKRRRTLYVHGRILEGPHRGIGLFLALPISPVQSSAFYEAWAIAMLRKPCRGERMRFGAFPGKVFSVHVRTVTRTGLGRLRAPIARYSIIQTLLELLGTREAWTLLPHTEYRKPHTEYHIPPTPGVSAGVTRGSGAVSTSAGDRIGVGSPEPEGAETTAREAAMPASPPAPTPLAGSSS